MGAAATAVPGALFTASPGLRSEVQRAGRRHLLLMFGLMAPGVILLLGFFVTPLLLFLFRSIHNPEIPAYLPRTVASFRAWETADPLPPAPVFAALVQDLSALRDRPEAATLGRRLNYALPGYRGLVTKTVRQVRSVPEAEARAELAAIDPQWENPAYWAILRQQSGILTGFYLLTALDLERKPDGSLGRVAADQAIFLDLYRRTIVVSLGVTLLCMLIGYPVARVLAAAAPSARNWLLMPVLIPFWTSLLVRTTAWVILLQSEGALNKILAWLGLIERPLPMIFNTTGVFIAMVHVLLPYMILPLYSVMKGISPTCMQAAASLGASPWRVFRTIYLPLTLPGLAAGATLVFVLSVGFYVTPALVGGPGDQMIGYFIAYFTDSAVNWGLASALGALLLVIVGAVYLLLGRMIGFERLRIR